MAYTNKVVCVCDGCKKQVDASNISYGKYGNTNAPERWIRVKTGQRYETHLHFHDFACLSTWAAKQAKDNIDPLTLKPKATKKATKKGGK